MPRIHPLTVRCEQCGTSFLTYRAASQVPRFCSRSCSKRRPADTRFWEKVDTSGDCWTWTASLTRYGYGSFNAGQGHGVVLAHRFSYQLANGDIPNRHEICHRCDNPRCVRPAHLFAALHAVNMADAAHKGRVWRRANRPIFTPDVVTRIRTLTATHTHKQIAELLHMSSAYVSILLRRGHSSSSQKVKQPL